MKYPAMTRRGKLITVCTLMFGAIVGTTLLSQERVAERNDTVGNEIMRELLVNVIANSDVLLIGRVYAAGPVSIEDLDFVRVTVEPRIVLTGKIEVGKIIELDIPAAGRETPETTAGQDYLFFLVKNSRGTDSDLAAWRSEPMTSPVFTPQQGPERGAFLAGINEAVALTNGKQTEAEVKHYVLNALHGWPMMFRTDASRMALNVAQWSAPEIELLRSYLAENERAAISGPERNNWVALIAQKGSAEQVKQLAYAELSADDSDALYFGLAERQDGTATNVLIALLGLDEWTVQTRALRIAGLLRRADIIDRFEQGLSRDSMVRPNINDFRQAISEARSLVERDY
jgi:hypothetical protein